MVKAFFAGEFNCLVATCIGEEGLDIGEVDLIVSFDALSSPVRMVQRMGRTGRKRAGKVRTRTTSMFPLPTPPYMCPRGHQNDHPLSTNSEKCLYTGVALHVLWNRRSFFG